MHVLLHSLSLAIAFATFTGSALAESASPSASPTEQPRKYTYARISLRETDANGNPGKHVCGGSLIAPDMVLTAASCKDKFGVIFYNGVGEISGSNYSRRHFIREDDISNELIRHDCITDMEFFGNPKYYKDVMVIKLNETFAMSGDPVRIRKDMFEVSDVTNLRVLDVGQGNDELHSSVQEISVDFTNVNDNNLYGCSKVADDLDLSGNLRTFRKYALMCAPGGNERCSLESGSPLILKGENEQDDRQVGIVGWDYNCTHLDVPVVYTRLEHEQIYNFIEREVCHHSVAPPDYFICPSEQPSSQPSLQPSFSA